MPLSFDDFAGSMDEGARSRSADRANRRNDLPDQDMRDAGQNQQDSSQADLIVRSFTDKIEKLQRAMKRQEKQQKVTKEYVQTLQESTSFEKFMASAHQPEDEHVKALQSLGLTLPPGLSNTSQVRKDQALKLYLAMVNKIAEKKVDSDKAAERELKEQAKLREAIRAKDPKDHFESAVKQALSNIAKKQVDPRVDYTKAAASRCNPAECIDWNKKAESKRRFTKSQLAARKAQGSKGKGKTDGAGQSSQQNQAQPPTHSSKSKGKGKHQQPQQQQQQQQPAQHKGKGKGSKGGKHAGKGGSYGPSQVFHNLGPTSDKPRKHKGGKPGGKGGKP
ncbi:unnamed protein product [Cladocopium goreaui]|uniref:Reverse transcriptase domain-containing protein n=1 Tax=Cladocopium goreaui TaxID=2562237 RepID=A0A9P1CGZ7_9DINO|nr:unnamed protein product [Cladocopium goreaui]